MFNLSFLNSIILFGLVAGIIPVLIHLFVKHHPKVVYFSSLRFLKQIQKNQARIIKLRQILLLITRILIIIFLILALSRPVLKTLLPSIGWQTHAPTVVVMIIDNSFSMNYLEGKNTILDNAKETAKDIIHMLNDKDKLMVLTLNKNYNSQNSYFSIPSKVNTKINKISISDNTQKLKSVLLKAEEKLAHQDIINKEIYFITDNQKYTWDKFTEITGNIKTNIFIIPVNKNKAKINLSTTSAMYIPRLLSRTNQPEIKATIKNYSQNKNKNIIVSLILNDITREEKVISLNPYQSRQISFECPIKGEKFYYGEVKLKDEMLPDDNSFYFNFSPDELPKIIVISNVDIPFQFSSALDIITNNNWQKISQNEINDDIVINNHLFIFYRLKNFSQKLEFFADNIRKKGKSIFLIPGIDIQDNIPLQTWLRKDRISFNNLDNQNSKIGFINKIHPITNIFSEEMFRKTTIKRMWDISANDFTILIANNNNSPIFVIKDRFIISTIDFTEDWSNIVYQPCFPVLLYNIGEYLGKENSRLYNYPVGTSLTLNSTGELELLLPNGENIPISIPANSVRKQTFTQTDQQGHYFLKKNDVVQTVYSLNSSREESNLAQLSEKEIKAINNLTTNVHFLSINNWKSQILTSRYGYELWKTFLWIVLGLLIIEMVLAYSGKRVFRRNKEIGEIRR